MAVQIVLNDEYDIPRTPLAMTAYGGESSNITVSMR